MGKLVVIEGLDGSGKATQTALLAETLAAQKQRVRMVSFPDYKSHSSALVRMYLSGEFGQTPGAVNAYAASSFYAVDRYASYVKSWADFYNGGGFVLADRYTTSNAIHQCAKLPEGEWEAFNTWLLDYEYEKLCIPRPDLVICLDVEPAVSQKLLLDRYGDENKRDIHEQDMDYLARCRAAALWCAAKYGWKLVVCSKNGTMRGRDAIARDIETMVRTYMLSKEAL